MEVEKIERAVAPPSLRRNFSWVLFGQLIFTATNWFTTFLLVKLGGAAVAGRYSTGVAITTPVMSLSQLMLRSVITTDTKAEFSVGDYLAMRIASTALAFVAIIGIVAFGRYDLDLALCVIWFAIAPGLDGIADVYQAFQQKHEVMAPNGISMAARGVLKILLLGVAYFFTHNLAFSLIVSAVASLALLVGYDIPNSQRLARALDHAGQLQHGATWESTLRPRWIPAVQKKLLLVALPLGISVGLTTVNIFLSRLFVIGYLSETQVGIFSGITALMNLGSQALLSVSTTIMPRLSKYRDTGDSKSFMALTAKFGMIATVSGILAILAAYFFGEKILTICFNHEFALHNDIFVLTMVAGLIFFWSLPFGTALTALRAFKSQIWASGMVTVIGVASGFYLVPRYGLLGAAYVTIIAMAVRCLVLGILFYRSRGMIQVSARS